VEQNGATTDEDQLVTNLEAVLAFFLHLDLNTWKLSKKKKKGGNFKRYGVGYPLATALRV